ncbi:MAG: hydrogenase maturation protease [Nitrospiraceae bacterium]|nr:MAG: hydrogenase maturation protease [Nitrospiraceae bacterium]
MSTLILGIGNLLLCDEGIGVHAVRALQQENLPPDVITFEAGTALLDALPEIGRAEHIIIIDAMRANHAPGTVYIVPLGECVRPEYTASLHGFDMQRVLYLAGRTSPADAIVIGIEPARIGWGTELSPIIRDAIPVVIETVKTEIANFNSRPPSFPLAGNQPGGKITDSGQSRIGSIRLE